MSTQQFHFLSCLTLYQTSNILEQNKTRSIENKINQIYKSNVEHVNYVIIKLGLEVGSLSRADII